MTRHEPRSGRAAVSALVGGAAGIVAAALFTVLMPGGGQPDPRTPRGALGEGVPRSESAPETDALLRELITEVRALRRTSSRPTQAKEAREDEAEAVPPPAAVPGPVVERAPLPGRARHRPLAERKPPDWDALAVLRTFQGDEVVRREWLLTPETDVEARFGFPTGVLERGAKWEYVRNRRDGSPWERFILTFDELGRLAEVYYRQYQR